MGKIDRRRGVNQPCLIIIERDSEFSERTIGRKRENRVNGGD